MTPVQKHLLDKSCIFQKYQAIFSRMLIMQHGDIESNPGPSKKHRPLTCCHWNVNSLTAHKMFKKSLIEAYNSNHKYDFICISET